MTAKYDEVAAQLAALDQETKAVRSGIDQQKELVENSIKEVESAVKEMREGDKKREEDMKKVKEEVDEIKESLPKVSSLVGNDSIRDIENSKNDLLEIELESRLGRKGSGKEELRLLLISFLLPLLPFQSLSFFSNPKKTPLPLFHSSTIARCWKRPEKLKQPP